MEEQSNLFDSELDPESRNEFSELARWAKTLGVIAFVLMGVAFLFLLLAATVLQTLLPLDGNVSQGAYIGILVVVFLIVAGIFGSLLFFLVRGSNRLRRALVEEDQIMFNEGLGDFKTFFKSYSILAVIALALSFRQ